MSINPAIRSLEEPPRPFSNIDLQENVAPENSPADIRVSETAQSRFPKLKTGLVSLKNRVAAQINRANGFLLSLVLAAYPIAKLALVIIAHFTVGAAIVLPPVALGLLIGAATLFLLTMLLDVLKSKDMSKVKIVLLSSLVFALAPITAPICALGLLRDLAKKAKPQPRKNPHQYQLKRSRIGL